MSEKPAQAERVGHLPTLIGLQSLPPKGVTQWEKAAVTIRRLPRYLATITLPHHAKIVRQKARQTSIWVLQSYTSGGLVAMKRCLWFMLLTAASGFAQSYKTCDVTMWAN